MVWRLLGEGRRNVIEAWSSGMRLAPSTGVPGSNGIPRPSLTRLCPRLDKGEHERRLRGFQPLSVAAGGVMFAGIDIASERHMLARLDPQGVPIGKPIPITEDRGVSETLCI